MKGTPTQEELKGTTINERLHLCGLLYDFDQAKRKRNKERMVEILEASGLLKAAAEETAEAAIENRMKGRRIFRIALPALLLLSSAYCAYGALYCAWAHTAPPDTHNDYYEKWYYIYGILFVIQPLIAGAVIYLLRPKQKVEPVEIANT